MWGNIPQSVIDEAVDQWTARLCAPGKARGINFRTSAVHNRFFQSHPTTKQALFQSHPQSTEENAFHFTCLACGSSRGSVGTQEYSSVKNFYIHSIAGYRTTSCTKNYQKPVNFYLRCTKSNLGSCYTVRVITVTTVSEQRKLSKSDVVESVIAVANF